jgi:mRNA interferase MazF
VRYPFSDLSQSKLRPALVLAGVSANDYILCQITTKPYGAKVVVEIRPEFDSKSGLRAVSYARPEKLFTGHESIILDQLGTLENASVEKIISEVIAVLKS